jgi:hypothetical protein
LGLSSCSVIAFLGARAFAPASSRSIAIPGTAVVQLCFCCRYPLWSSGLCINCTRALDGDISGGRQCPKIFLH